MLIHNEYKLCTHDHLKQIYTLVITILCLFLSPSSIDRAIAAAVVGSGRINWRGLVSVSNQNKKRTSLVCVCVCFSAVTYDSGCKRFFLESAVSAPPAAALARKGGGDRVGGLESSTDTDTSTYT